MGRDLLYLTIAVVAVVVGALAFTLRPQVTVEVRTQTVTVTETPTVTTVTEASTQTAVSTSAPSTPAVKVTYNETLANRGVQLFKDLGCTACHTVKSVGITVGGNLGPDLGRALLGSVGVERGTAGGPMMMQYFQKHGLADPAADPVKAAQLLAKFLAEGDQQLAPTMTVQVQGFAKTYGDRWRTEIVPTLVEMLKMAATK